MVRVLEIAVLAVFCLSLMGCPPKSDNNFPDNLTVGDLAPVYPDGSTETHVLKAISLDFHVVEIPQENFSKLDEIRRILNIKPIKFNNYLAFSDNSFSAYYGRNQLRRAVYDQLQIAEAQEVINPAILLIDGESNDITVQQLTQTQAVYYYNLKGEQEAARIGPGYIALHISVEKADSLDDAATVKMFPLFTRMPTYAISQFTQMEKLKDFPFESAALQLDMIPGDFIVLAPERNINDMSTLSGLFFSNPAGSLFYNSPQDRRPPETKPSIRVYIITCVGLNF